MVTGDAVERRAHAARGVLLAMAVDTPAHRQRGRRGSQADEMLQIVEQPRPRLRTHHAHALDGTMTALAFDTGADMRLVREIGELGHLEHAHPRYRFTALRVAVDFLDFRVVLRADDPVTAHAPLDGGQPRVLGAPRIGVAVLTADL